MPRQSNNNVISDRHLVFITYLVNRITTNIKKARKKQSLIKKGGAEADQKAMQTGWSDSKLSVLTGLSDREPSS